MGVRVPRLPLMETTIGYLGTVRLVETYPLDADTVSYMLTVFNRAWVIWVSRNLASSAGLEMGEPLPFNWIMCYNVTDNPMQRGS